MKQRLILINGCRTTDRVLLQITENEDGERWVEIAAWHHYDDSDWYQYEEVYFPETGGNIRPMARFIADFSEVSANEFANSMTF